MKRTLAILAALMFISPPAFASADSPCGVECMDPLYQIYLPMVTTAHPADEMDAITRYLTHVYTDGDWLNDWLTHVRPEIRDALLALGQSIEGARAGRFTFTIVWEGETTDQAEFLRGWTWAQKNGYSAYQSMWIGMGEVLDNHLDEDVMAQVWHVIEEQCVN